MKQNVTSITPWTEPWRIKNADKAMTVSITVEVRLDFLENAWRGEFDQVGKAVAAELHALYRQAQHEAKYG